MSQLDEIAQGLNAALSRLETAVDTRLQNTVVVDGAANEALVVEADQLRAECDQLQQENALLRQDAAGLVQRLSTALQRLDTVIAGDEGDVDEGGSDNVEGQSQHQEAVL